MLKQQSKLAYKNELPPKIRSLLIFRKTSWFFLRRKTMNLVLLLSVVVVVALIAKLASCDKLHPLSDEFINNINEQQSLWKAGRNFREDIPLSYIKKLMACHIHSDKLKLPEFRHDLVDVKIPDSFDWRDSPLNCSTLRDIRDQGACGSCWANAAAEVISDRICIHSKGNLDAYISAEDLLSCCHNCGFGCQGGDPLSALQYWVEAGIVTGGPYDSNQGCRPYEIPPCEHGDNGSRTPCDPLYFEFNTPECKRNCRSGYSKSYNDDRYFGKSSYTVPNDIQHIQTEIMKNGPVTATFKVYDDFLHYKTGVYRHTKGEDFIQHVVKIIGWGVANSTPYWLVANSCNSDWGDSGYFKILRGKNHCGIEESIAAGIPA